jgi:hypothetical protein
MQGHLRPALAHVRSPIENQTRRSDQGLVGLRLFSPPTTSLMRPGHPLSTRVYARNRPRLLAVIFVVLGGAIGCGSDPVDSVLNPDFMVGDWLAESQVVTSVADPQELADLTALGAVYTLSVQPSGRSTAISEGFGPPIAEFGNLTVDGPNVVFIPEFGERSMALWEQVGDSVILTSGIDYDFNLDGTPEAATLRRVLIPR